MRPEPAGPGRWLPGHGRRGSRRAPARRRRSPRLEDSRPRHAPTRAPKGSSVGPRVNTAYREPNPPLSISMRSPEGATTHSAGPGRDGPAPASSCPVAAGLQRVIRMGPCR